RSKLGADRDDQLGRDGARLETAIRRHVQAGEDGLQALVRALPRAEDIVARLGQRLDELGERLPRLAIRRLQDGRLRVAGLAARLRTPAELLRAGKQALDETARRLVERHTVGLERRAQRLALAGGRLHTLGYQRTLARGYALVRSTDDGVVATAEAARGHAQLSVEFQDGRLDVTTGTASRQRTRKAPKRTAPKPATRQETLL
ncbi:MAG: exodeoxyribonuclease VII large subunit, partial [Pseudomonadota bacterium]